MSEHRVVGEFDPDKVASEWRARRNRMLGVATIDLPSGGRQRKLLRFETNCKFCGCGLQYVAASERPEIDGCQRCRTKQPKEIS